jgi:hypothetical protein
VSLSPRRPSRERLAAFSTCNFSATKPSAGGAGVAQLTLSRTAQPYFSKKYFFDLLSGLFTPNLMVAEHISNG